MRAFLDAGVPDSVGHVFLQCGHRVIYHREALPDKTPDLVVAATALENNSILVAHDKDMKQIGQRYGMTARNDRFEKLNLIRLRCSEVLSSKRLQQAMTFIELEWSIKMQKSSRRMWIEIGEHFLRTYR
jgi:predicted nuclease of predicted toxin-antitoxin system